MYELAKQSRAANRDKAKRLSGGDPHQQVDASDYRPPSEMMSGEKTGPKQPVRRKFKAGGKVEGEAPAHRADKSPRKGPKREHKADGGSNVPTQRFEFAPSGGSRLAKGLGLNGGGSVSDGTIQGERPKGGRLPRKSGGRASKGKTNINIIIGAGKDQPQAGPPMPGPMPAMAPPGPGGPPGLPPQISAAMAAQQGAGPPPMPRKRGGRAHYDAGGSVGGLGALPGAPPSSLPAGLGGLGAGPPASPQAIGMFGAPGGSGQTPQSIGLFGSGAAQPSPLTTQGDIRAAAAPFLQAGQSPATAAPTAPMGQQMGAHPPVFGAGPRVMARKAGGRVKTFNAGAGGGKGRLEKRDR